MQYIKRYIPKQRCPMCGRFEFNLSDPYMQSVFKDLQGRHNYELLHSGEIFPTDSVPALVMKNGAVVS